MNLKIKHRPDSVLLQINQALQSTSRLTRSGTLLSSVTGSLLKMMVVARSWTTSWRRRTTRTTRLAGSPSPQPWTASVSPSPNSSRGRSTSSESLLRTSLAAGHHASPSPWSLRTSLVSKRRNKHEKKHLNGQKYDFMWVEEKFQRTQSIQYHEKLLTLAPHLPQILLMLRTLPESMRWQQAWRTSPGTSQKTMVVQSWATG